MAGLRLCFLIAIVLLMVLLACAPKATPAPAPTPALGTPQASPITGPPTVPAMTSEEAAWAKVVKEAKKEGKVNVYTWAFTSDIGRAVFKAFEEQHGIRVEAVTGVGQTLVERIRSELAANRNIADTLDTSPTIVLNAREMGLTVPVVDDLPVLRQKGVWRLEPKYDPEGHVLGVAQGFMTTFINTTRVKPGEEPHTLKDLLDPKWKGAKVGIASPLIVPFFSYMYYFRDKYGVDEDFFRQILKQQPRIGPTVREPNVWLASGETAMSVPASDAQMAPFIKEGAPIKAIELEGGAIVYPVPGIAMVKNAPHPNAARLFINWLLSPEGQYAYLKARVSAPIRSDVPDFGADVFQFKPQKTIPETYEASQSISRLMRELVVARLMGLEK